MTAAARKRADLVLSGGGIKGVALVGAVGALIDARFTLPTSTVDEAALQMDLLDYDSPVHREGHEHRQCPLPCRTDGLPSGTSEPSIGRVAGRRRAARDRQSAASAAAYC